MKRKITLKTVALIFFITLLISIGLAAAAANDIPITGLVDTSLPIDFSQLMPSECTGMSFTNVIRGMSHYDGTDTNELIYGTEGNDKLSGGGGNDCIIGGEGNDNIDGNDGDDVLLGGLGNDQLDGGEGNDSCWGGEGNNHNKNCENP